MAYSLSFADLPPMDELSLDDSQRPASRWTTSFAQTPSRLSPLSLTFPSYIGVHDLTPTKPFTDSYLSRWSVPGWQSTLDFGADLVPSLYSNTEFEAPSWGTPQFSKSPTRSLFLPRLPLPEIDLPPSPSDTCSSVYSDLSSSPPSSLHVVCDIPVVAPRPLPYHSPTFLQFDSLPDADADLSRPPYTQGPAKRKREADSDLDETISAKRPATSASRKSSSSSSSHSSLPGRATRASQRVLRR